MTSATGNNAPGRRGGFTLIELGVAIFVISLMLALAAPQFVRSYNRSLLSETARSLATTCQLARVQAVSQQRPALLHLDVRQQRFWLTQDADGPDPEPQTIKVQQVSPRVVLVKLEGPVTEMEGADQNKAEVRFLPNGTSEAVTVYFRGEGRAELVAVSLDPITAKTVVYPVTP